uniref:DUF4283 domain-containing protein n=1 Tax=Glycine max TaxID=3847 RepID=A0A0R0F8F2_SOYBN
MEQFLVMNVLGKKIKYRMLDNKLQLEWARVGSVRLVDMPNDHNIVQFTAMEDYQHALFQGPWIIADNYFVVQRRRPFFSLDTKVIQKIAMWTHIHRLPIELYKDKFSWMVDLVYIKIDLQKKLVFQINVLIRNIIKLEYKGLHSICFSCGKYGQKQTSCTKSFIEGIENTMAATGAVVEATTMEVEGGKTKVSDVDISPNGVTKGESVESKNPKKGGLYGLWMIVRRNNSSLYPLQV